MCVCTCAHGTDIKITVNAQCNASYSPWLAAIANTVELLISNYLNDIKSILTGVTVQMGLYFKCVNCVVFVDTLYVFVDTLYVLSS